MDIERSFNSDKKELLSNLNRISDDCNIQRFDLVSQSIAKYNKICTDTVYIHFNIYLFIYFPMR